MNQIDSWYESIGVIRAHNEWRHFVPNVFLNCRWNQQQAPGWHVWRSEFDFAVQGPP
jgi:hypothetical protein